MGQDLYGRVEYLILVRQAEVPIVDDSNSIWRDPNKETGPVLSHLHELPKDSRSGVELLKNVRPDQSIPIGLFMSGSARRATCAALTEWKKLVTGKHGTPQGTPNPPAKSEDIHDASFC